MISVTLLLLLSLSGCGTINIDGYEVQSIETSFGDFHAKLNGTKTGTFFIKRKAPYELLLSFSVKNIEIKKLSLREIRLINNNSNETLFYRESVVLDPTPKHGESRIYFSELSVLDHYDDVTLNFIVEWELLDKKLEQTFSVIFNKESTHRWWSFFELV